MSIEIVVPELGESVLEATVSQWMKNEGDRVEVGEVLVELETDKVNLEVGAEHAGILTRIDHQAGDDVNVGDVLGMLEEVEQELEPAGGRSEEAVQAEEAAKTEPVKKEEPQIASATPVAQRLAQERGIDLLQVSASGPGGRVTKGDVEDFLEQRKAQSKAAPPRAKISETSPKQRQISEAVVREERREERVRMTRRRRTIAQRLVEVQQNSAMLTTFNEINMSAVMDLRKRRNEDFQKRYGVKLGITSFFVKATVGALKSFPRLNAEVQGDEMLLKYYYDIGVAIGDPEGLVVPVVRDADRKSFADIETEIKDFVNKAGEGSLSIEDLSGGTFSITNGGVFGSLMSTPILNPPQVGILGLHKIEQRPIVMDGQMVIQPMMYVAVSYDHRIVDGREAVQFLVRIKELIEDPEALLLEG